MPYLSHICLQCPRFQLSSESKMTPYQHVSNPDVSHNSDKQSCRIITTESSQRGCGCGVVVTLTWKYVSRDCAQRTRLISTSGRTIWLIECIARGLSLPAVRRALFCQLWLLCILKSGKAAGTIAFSRSQGQGHRSVSPYFKLRVT